MNDFEFISPIDGDVLFDISDGVSENDALITKVLIKASEKSEIIINGIKANFKNGVFCAEVKLYSYRNTIWARDIKTGLEKSIVIYWFKDAYKTYRFGVDDVIWCFEDIYKHQDEYISIFENPFLSIFKELNDIYGTKVHMHVYFQNEDGSFNLTMFPDKYKEEFKQNSTWLKFTFHALANDPDSPYKHAPFEQVFKEGKMVEKELRRFAGDEVLSKVTAQHWADSDIYATRAFRSLGYKVLSGYFALTEQGEPYVSYYLNSQQTKHFMERDFWVDNKEDIIFVKDDIIIDKVNLEEISKHLDNIKINPTNSAFMYLIVHEQYFYSDYRGYQENYKEKVFAAVKWMHENGYKSTFISDIAFEKALN